MATFTFMFLVNGRLVKRKKNNSMSPGTMVHVMHMLFVLFAGCFCLERFPLPLGAWDGLRYFIVALPEPSIQLF